LLGDASLAVQNTSDPTVDTVLLLSEGGTQPTGLYAYRLSMKPARFAPCGLGLCSIAFVFRRRCKKNPSTPINNNTKIIAMLI
jgi:hypothetical protein